MILEEKEKIICRKRGDCKYMCHVYVSSFPIRYALNSFIISLRFRKWIIFIVHMLLVLFLINLSRIFSYYYLRCSFFFSNSRKDFSNHKKFHYIKTLSQKKKKNELIKKNYFIFKWFNKKWNSIHGLTFYMVSQR